jgi:hypothetical protein
VVKRDVWEHSGALDVVDRKLAMMDQKLGGETMPGASSTSRDFWLVEHADRIMNTVSGLAFTGLVAAISDEACIDDKGHAKFPGYYRRQEFKGTIDRAKEIGERFVHLTLALQPFALEYYEGMTEADLRAWAAGVVSALRE